MSDYAVLDENKKIVPVDVMVWMRWFENIDQRQVARDEMGGVVVSTVFLGLNHGTKESPLWFETMIFGGAHDDYQDRYATYEEAQAGHVAAVELAKQTEEGADDATE